VRSPMYRRSSGEFGRMYSSISGRCLAEYCSTHFSGTLRYSMEFLEGNNLVRKIIQTSAELQHPTSVNTLETRVPFIGNCKEIIPYIIHILYTCR
jgi:hypothetical protein